MAQISINSEVIEILLKRLEQASELIREGVDTVEKSVDMAELEGWNDKKYFEFKESFSDTKNSIAGVLNRFEDEHRPFLEKLLAIAEELE